MILSGTFEHWTAENQHRSTCVLVVCCIALFEVCFVGNAKAACGDYVTVGGEQQTMRGSHLPKMDFPAPLCHGPHCQRHVPSPAAPRPSLGQSPTDLANLAAAIHAPQRTGRWLIFEAQLQPPSGALRQIEHPPRS